MEFEGTSAIIERGHGLGGMTRRVRRGQRCVAASVGEIDELPESMLVDAVIAGGLEEQAGSGQVSW